MWRQAWLIALLLGGASTAVLAQAQSAHPPGHADDGDDTGTNPAKFSRTLILYNEFRSLGDDAGYDEMVFRYIQPFGELKVQITLPLDSTDVSGATQSGFGDVGLKFNYRAFLNAKNALILNLDTTYPTATKDAFTSGKYVASPGATFAMFFANGAKIFAPSFQQKLSFAGDSDRADVNQSQVDLYFVWKPTKTSWVIVDPQVLYDWEAGTTFGQTEIEYGRMLFGGMSAYLRPGIGIGADRPLDWNVEFGVKVVH
jgi:hypothetical protein